MKLRALAPRLATLNTCRIQTMQPGSWRTDKQSSTARGYGYKWQQAREAYLKQHPLCVYCEKEGRTSCATVVDHRVPHRGDQSLFWDETNWQALCKRCHDVIKKREEAQSTPGG